MEDNDPRGGQTEYLMEPTKHHLKPRWNVLDHRRFYHCCELLTSSTMTPDAAQSPCPGVEADGQLWIINHYGEALLILIDNSFYVVKPVINHPQIHPKLPA